MLKKIKVKNFYSIAEEQEISFEINAKDILDESARTLQNGESINLVSCVIGHNASGKTNLLKAITFILWFINNSYMSLKSEDRIPVESHKLKKNKPTEIVIGFVDKKIFYEYSIKFNQKEILEECLRKKNKRIVEVFKLNRDGTNVEIKSKSLKINKMDENRFKERGNVPLLSSLIDTGYLTKMTYFKNFESNVRELGLIRNDAMFEIFNAAQVLYKNKELYQEVVDFVKEIDLGLSDFQFTEMRTKENDEIVQMLACTHKTEKDNFTLPIFKESNGTQHSISLALKILSTLKKGGLLVIDEIESGLHPHVIKKLISLFEAVRTNPYKAQIIFSTHQHWLINDRTKTQIFLAEKGEETLETEVYRLDDVEGVRNDENYFNKYMAGVYGGVPRLDWM